MRTKRKIALLVVGFVIAALGVGVFLFTKDDPPPDCADLRIPHDDIPDEENAFTYFEKAVEELHLYDKTEADQFFAILTDKAWDETFAREFLDKNGNWLDLIEQGLRCERFQVPEITSYHSAVPYLSDWRQIARLASFRALYLFRTGDEKEAFDLCIRTAEFGHKMQNAGGAVINYLVGVAVKHTALARMRRMLPKTSLSPEDLAPYIGMLAPYGANEEGLANAYKVEYGMAARFVDDLASGRLRITDMGSDQDPPPEGTGNWAARLLRRARTSFLLKPNRTKRLFADALRIHIRNVARTYFDMDEYEPPEVDVSGKGAMRLFRTGNSMGPILERMLIPSLWGTLQQKCNENTLVAATRILIALKCHRLERGRLPESLDELVPEYLEAVPMDDFDGLPIKYSKDKGVVYATGKDLVDNGGIAEDDVEGNDGGEGYDLIYKIGF